MIEDRKRFRRRKQILTMLHIFFVLIAVAGISAMYLNANYGKGIKWIYTEAYEDSDSFCSQLQADINKLFTYVGYRDMFETDGQLDMHKPIVVYTDGPGAKKQTYNLDQIIRYAKTRGYYLDDSFSLTGSPMSMDDDEESDKEIYIDYQAYNPEFINGDDMSQRMTKEDLALDILEHLGEYYSIYYNYVEKQTNLQFRIVYTSDDGNEKVYTNVPEMTREEIKKSGKYLYVPGNSIKMEHNLAVMPVDVASYLEIWNPYDNDQYYLVVAVDTSYPNVDSYSVEASEYREARSNFIMGIAGVIMGSIGVIITLMFLVILSGHILEGNQEIRLFPVDEIYTEVCLLLWAVATAVALYFGRYVGNRLMSLFFEESQWSYWSKVIKLLILYTSIVLCSFSLIRRYKARALWRTSLARKALDASREYVGRTTFAAGTGFCYLIFVGANAAMICSILFLYVFREEKLSYRILLYVFFVVFMGLDGWIYHQLFKKAVQRDWLDEAISNIAKGDTSYQISVTRLSGKEKDMGQHINNISTGLDRALQEQVKSERLKADLITNVSHDIKTPLTSIINYVDLLKRENIKDPKIAAYLEVLDQKSQRLKTLTEDLVEASKASSGNMKLEVSDINFVELVQQTNGEFEERFAMRRLELVCNVPDDILIIRADGRRLWRVLENLYTNAVKYAMEHSRVYVDVAETDGQAVFTIKNVSENPLNISPDEITERFVRGDVSRTTEGSGLGLSIAKSLTQLQKGLFQIIIDGDLFKAMVAFPVERAEHKSDKGVAEASLVQGFTDGQNVEGEADGSDEDEAAESAAADMGCPLPEDEQQVREER